MPNHIAPQDCTSQKGVRCDVCFGPMPVVAPEHPAARAARMVREMHEQNIALIDGGHVFTKDGADVSQKMRAACVEQIAICNNIIERAEKMDPSLWEPAALVLEEMQREMAKIDAAKEEPALPEMGDYDHKA